MNTQNKQHIAQEVKALAVKTSQNKVAKQAGVSSATISQIINGNWELIAAEMWRKIQVNLRLDAQWQIAETTNLRLITQLLEAAQVRHLAFGISFEAGAGKSAAYRRYARKYNNVIYIECKNYWSKKSYVQNLVTASGLSPEGTTEELIEQFIDQVKSQASPLIIIDQFDKLKDASMDLFMDFYNELESHCGFVLSGVPALEKRIKRGVQRDKIGYRELFSRIGRKFIKLDELKLEDVRAVCNANGLFDEDEIKMIKSSCEGDLRRVRKEVERYNLLKTAN